MLQFFGANSDGNEPSPVHGPSHLNDAQVADVSTESGQVDFAADVVKLKAANADAVFVYSNEEECARIMREARKQGLKGPFVGDTTLLSQKTTSAGPRHIGSSMLARHSSAIPRAIRSQRTIISGR